RRDIMHRLIEAELGRDHLGVGVLEPAKAGNANGGILQLGGRFDFSVCGYPQRKFVSPLHTSNNGNWYAVCNRQNIGCGSRCTNLNNRRYETALKIGAAAEGYPFDVEPVSLENPALLGGQHRKVKGGCQGC